MIFRVPIYVAAASDGSFGARPLFFDEPSRSDANLNRLVSKLARDITKAIEADGKEARHELLSRWTFAPAITQHRLTLEIELRAAARRRPGTCSSPSGTWASGWRSLRPCPGCGSTSAAGRT